MSYGCDWTTTDLLVVVAWPETSPMSGSGEAVVVGPLRLGFRRGERQSYAMRRWELQRILGEVLGW
jgi:hypothetical protein